MGLFYYADIILISEMAIWNSANSVKARTVNYKRYWTDSNWSYTTEDGGYCTTVRRHVRVYLQVMHLYTK